MASTQPSSGAAAAAEAPPNRDPTFRAYTASQASRYSQYRGGYPDELIRIIMDMHRSGGGGGFDVLVDVGCGPGTATVQVAPYFARAYGLDAGEAMVATARERGVKDGSGADVRFEVAPAEEIGAKLGGMGVREGSVDCIVSATAAHWFDMPLFWREAARMLRPGGSVFLWCSGSWYPDRRTTPGWEKVQGLLDEFELEVLREYMVPGNQLCRGLYRGLTKPWDEEVQDEMAKRAFRREASVYRTWNEDGKLEELEGGRVGFLRELKSESMERTKMVLSTSSSVTRWREANRERVERGEVRDCVDELLDRLKQTLEEAAGGGGKVDKLEGGLSMGLLMVKKAKE